MRTCKVMMFCSMHFPVCLQFFTGQMLEWSILYYAATLDRQLIFSLVQLFISQPYCRKMSFLSFKYRERKEFILLFTIELEQFVVKGHLQNHNGWEFFTLSTFWPPQRHHSQVWALKTPFSVFLKMAGKKRDLSVPNTCNRLNYFPGDQVTKTNEINSLYHRLH